MAKRSLKHENGRKSIFICICHWKTGHGLASKLYHDWLGGSSMLKGTLGWQLVLWSKRASLARKQSTLHYVRHQRMFD